MAGLQSAQAGMLVTSQNVTGSSVEGYVRRTSTTRINGMSPTSIDLTGTSFAVEGFSRYFDSLLQGQVLLQQSQTSYTQTLTQSVSALDAMLTDPATSVATALGNFFNAAGSIANEPSNYAYQQSLIGNARQVADRVRGLANAVGQISDNAQQALADVLNQANTLTPQLASINAKIRSAATPGLAYPSADLLDERDRIVGKLQDLVGGTTLINEDGTASYLINGQHLVDREIANTFANSTGSSPVRSDLPLTGLRIKVASVDGRNPVLVPLVMDAVAQRAGDGTPLKDANGNSLMLAGQTALKDGKAGAYVHLIQNFVPTVQKSINLLAAQLVRKVSQVASGAGYAINPIFGFKSTAAGAEPLTGSSTDAAGKSLLENLLKPVPKATAMPSSVSPSLGAALSLANPPAINVDGMRLSINGVDTGVNVVSGGTTSSLVLSGTLQTPANAVFDFYGSTSSVVALTGGDTFTTSSTAGAAVGDLIFINGIDKGVTVKSLSGGDVTASGNITANVDDVVTFLKPNSAQDFSYGFVIESANPQSSHYRMAMDSVLGRSEFDARQFHVVGTFDASQFGNMDFTASAQLEALRQDFSSPVTFITSSVATTIATWKNDHKANEALDKSLSEQKSAITGVNLDEEAANLVKYQQLYNASSKLIQTGRQMFDTLLGMLSGN